MIHRIAIALLCSASFAMAQSPFASFDRASEPVLNDPHDLALGPDGYIYVANKFGGDVVWFDPETLQEVGRFGEGQLWGIHDVSFGPDGKLYTAVTGLNAVGVLSLTDDGIVADRLIQGFSNTEGALAHSNGAIYVMASGSGQLFRVENDQITNGITGLLGAHDVEEAPDGTIWVGDNRRRRVLQFSQDLELLREIDGPQYDFIGPRYLDITSDGLLVVADQEGHRILMIDPATNELLGVLGDGQPGLGPNKFDDPEGVLVIGNTYYFADSDNNRIVKYIVAIN